jgi:hypothetical protein
MTDKEFITAGIAHYLEARRAIIEFDESVQESITETMAPLLAKPHPAFRPDRNAKIKTDTYTVGDDTAISGAVPGRLPTGNATSIILGVWWVDGLCRVWAQQDTDAAWAKQHLEPLKDSGVGKVMSEGGACFVIPVRTSDEMKAALPRALSALLDATVAQAPTKDGARKGSKR